MLFARRDRQFSRGNEQFSWIIDELILPMIFIIFVNT